MQVFVPFIADHNPAVFRAEAFGIIIPPSVDITIFTINRELNKRMYRLLNYVNLTDKLFEDDYY